MGQATVDLRPRLLADSLAIVLSRRGYTMVDQASQEEPPVLVDLAFVDDHSRAPAGTHVVIELRDGPGARAHVYVDGVEVTTRLAGLADLDELLDRLPDRL